MQKKNQPIGKGNVNKPGMNQIKVNQERMATASSIQDQIEQT